LTSLVETTGQGKKAVCVDGAIKNLDSSKLYLSQSNIPGQSSVCFKSVPSNEI